MEHIEYELDEAREIINEELEVNGVIVTIPQMVSAYQSRLVENKAVTTPIPQPHIVQAKALIKNPNNKTLSTFLTTIAKEAMMKIQPGISIHEVSGRVVMHAGVPRGHWARNKEYLMLNPFDCAEFKIDSDGDNCGFLVTQNNQLNPRIKNPITKQIALSKEISEAEVGLLPFFPMTSLEYESKLKTERESAKSTWDEIFIRTHENLPIGTVSSTLNNRQFWDLRNVPYEDKIQCLDTDPEIFMWLEENLLGAVRKDDQSYGAENGPELPYTASLDTNGNVVKTHYRMRSDYSPFLTRISSIGSMSTRQIKWIMHKPLREHMHKVENLDIEFEAIPTITTDKSPLTYARQDGELVNRMIKLGIMQVTPLPNRTGINSYLCSIHNASGQTVGLVNTKRDIANVEGINYRFLLTPVWDVETNQLVDPIVHMNKISAHILYYQEYEDQSGEWISDPNSIGPDTAIRNPETMEITRFFPSYKTDFSEPKYSLKRTFIMKFILSYIGRYGIMAPTDHGKLLQPAINVEKSSIVIDFSQNMTSEQMLVFAKMCNDKHPICPSSKGSDRRVRRYFLAGADGLTPQFAKIGCNPRRAGQMLSQYSRSIKSSIMRVAVVVTIPEFGLTEQKDMGDPEQWFITPSGTEKMATDVFSPRVSHTPTEDGVETNYPTIDGSIGVAWVTNPRLTSPICKLITTEGDKCVAAGIGQVKYWVKTPKTHRQLMQQTNGNKTNNTLENVDVLIPITALAAKHTLELHTKDATLETIIFPNGTECTALICEILMHRTSAATENMPVRQRKRWIRGKDAHAAVAALRKVGGKYGYTTMHETRVNGELTAITHKPIQIETPNIEYAEQLISAAYSLMEILGLNLPEEWFPETDDFNYYSQLVPENYGELDLVF